jgi:hypothetical protein
VVGQTSESATVGVTRSGAVLYAPLLQKSAVPPTNVLQGPEFVVRSIHGGTRPPVVGPPESSVVQVAPRSLERRPPHLPHLVCNHLAELVWRPYLVE